MQRCNFKKVDGKRCKINSQHEFCHIHNKYEDCSVCYSKINPKQSLTTDCGHTFHKNCIEEWYERDNKCPMCRTNTQHHAFRVAISGNPLLVKMNVKFFMEKLQHLEHLGKFKGSKLAIDVINRNKAGVYNFHTKELLGTFKLS